MNCALLITNDKEKSEVYLALLRFCPLTWNGAVECAGHALKAGFEQIGVANGLVANFTCTQLQEVKYVLQSQITDQLLYLKQMSRIFLIYF